MEFDVDPNVSPVVSQPGSRFGATSNSMPA